MFAVRVPATIANLGPGFDTLGMALQLFMEAEVGISTGLNEFIYEGLNAYEIKMVDEDNLFIRAMNRVFEKAGRVLPPLRVHIKNDIPLGKGLGSSAAAIAGGLCAANFMLGQRYSTRQLLAWGLQMEGHADNIVPAMIGGLTTVMIYEGRVYYQKVCIPDVIKVVVAVPEIALSTRESRAVLPENVNMQDAVTNLQRACFLLASVYNSDVRNIHMAMEDTIYQPSRKGLIPGLEHVIEMASDAGAIGVALSGAGPSVAAFATGNEQQIGQAMMEAFAAKGIDSRVLYLTPYQEGIKILGKRF